MNITEPEIKVFLKQYENATNTHVFSNVADLINPEATYRFTDGDFVGNELPRPEGTGYHLFV